MPENPEDTCIVTTLCISSQAQDLFAEWQAKLHSAIATSPGFVSLEIIASQGQKDHEWTIVQRFENKDNLSIWRDSDERRHLFEALQPLLPEGDSKALCDTTKTAFDKQGGVTEVFVTQISPESESEYRKWIAKMHQAEAKFPGFRGVYVQSPTHQQGRNWITLLQFDTPEHLDRWLVSPERKAILHEAKDLISSLDTHRLITPYSGWFSSISKGGRAPVVWKETMLVLLVLYPIVMLELLLLSPLTASLNLSLATFIGNSLSVTLIAWPMMPIAIYYLRWWLAPESKRATLIGTCLLLGLYLIEVTIFWHLI